MILVVDFMVQTIVVVVQAVAECLGKDFVVLALQDHLFVPPSCA